MEAVNTDHIVLQHNECFCSHCGQKYAVNMPCPIYIFEAIINAFLAKHVECEKVKE